MPAERLSCSEMRKERKTNINNTVQSIFTSPLGAGRKWLTVLNLAEHVEKWSPDSMLLMPVSLRSLDSPLAPILVSPRIGTEITTSPTPQPYQMQDCPLSALS